MRDTRAPTHAAGQHGLSTAYESAILAERRASAGRASFSGQQITALGVLPLAIIPWAADRVVAALIGEPLVSFRIDVGWMLSIAVAAASLWLLVANPPRGEGRRKWLLVAYAGGAAAFAMTTSIATWQSWSHAVAEPPQRAFEFAKRCGKGCWRPVYQASDGRIIGTGDIKPLPPHAPHCVIVREVVGSRGLRWARVVERSRLRDRKQLHWPVRREDCFSDIPLDSLPR
ncbi:hypothetical protein [Sphingomonas glaciei]|uniref:Uncharacterized protein n=1 Tax=Sphingomonas glaciei TaxID=2938948 RepID=A0ABY5MXR8_9SPHN|nr:hypothetical protein [Sphingomonas glaciei]UUR08796.1 hypothetical protein M1K48_03950 [Sphingomonas glaciei]